MKDCDNCKIKDDCRYYYPCELGDKEHIQADALKSIEERAYKKSLEMFKPKANVTTKELLIEMAMEQEKITKQEMIEKACNVYADLLSAHGYNPIDVNNEVVRMKKELEG